MSSIGAGTLAAPALAAGPQISVTCSSPSSCTVSGSGFVPGGTVDVQAAAAGSTFYSGTLTASQGTLVCVYGVKPSCHVVGGGTFSAPLPSDYNLVCNQSASGTVTYTEAGTAVAVSKSLTFTGPCYSPTTITLSGIPAVVDTGWTNQILTSVTAGGHVVTTGTVTVAVKGGQTVCSYPVVDDGCTLSNLPAGTDQIVASYSGSTEPRNDPSSATATATVLQVQPTVNSQGPGWAGYVDVGDTYTHVSGSWIVPQAHCGNIFHNPGLSSVATWVGIDGLNENTVEQIGTDSNCGGPQAEYHAWWEMAPGGPTVIGVPEISYVVNAGDSMSASVTSTGTPGQFTLSITDNTAGWTYTTTQSVAGAMGGTAEWIAEQPQDGGLNLTDFGSVTFTQGEATGSNGITSPIWDHPNVALNMVTSSGTTQATTSSLSDDGTSFTITWQHP